VGPLLGLNLEEGFRYFPGFRKLANGGYGAGYLTRILGGRFLCGRGNRAYVIGARNSEAVLPNFGAVGKKKAARLVASKKKNCEGQLALAIKGGKRGKRPPCTPGSTE